ncbi:MAG: helix-turn-helix domain-containing protein [Burkholderiales bacterium]
MNNDNYAIPPEVIKLTKDKNCTIYRAWRMHKRISLYALAKRMQIPIDLLTKIENGKYEPTFRLLLDFATALSIMPELIDL